MRGVLVILAVIIGFVFILVQGYDLSNQSGDPSTSKYTSDFTAIVPSDQQALSLGYFGFRAAPKPSCRPQGKTAWDLVLDTSGSMKDPKIGRLKEAVINFSKNLSGDDPFGAQEFNSIVTEITPIDEFSKARDFENKINKLSVGGDTWMNDALEDANSRITAAISRWPNRQWNLVFFSDGAPNPDVQDPSSLASQIKASGKYTLITIALNAGVNGTKILQNMASSDSDYYQATSENDLNQIYQKIFHDQSCQTN